jgi:hypothetical protein
VSLVEALVPSLAEASEVVFRNKKPFYHEKVVIFIPQGLQFPAWAASINSAFESTKSTAGIMSKFI